MVDLILFNAKVMTMDPIDPQGDLVAVRGNQIAAVTGPERLSEFKGASTTLIDCGGHSVLPGFIDAHCHIHALAERLITIGVGPRSSVRSIRDIQAALRQAAQRHAPGSWLRAHGYDEFFLEEKRHPTREDLDAAAPLHPVTLTHRSGHARVLNTLALRHVGISIETPDPEGALIDRHHETGEPTGLLFDMGSFLAKRTPRLDDTHVEAGMRLANREFLSLGITSIQDPSPGNGRSQWQRFRRWKETGILHPRIAMMLGWEDFLAFSVDDFSNPVGEEQLRLAGVKVLIGEASGRLHPAPAALNDIVRAIHQAGWQVALHAIEEPTIEAACRAIEQALETFPRPDHRHRIEHCSVCPPALRRRLAALGTLVVTQPSFLYYNGERYLKTLPAEHLANLYPIAALLSAGITVAAGSDSPVAPLNPFKAISGAVSRRAETGAPVAPEQGIALDAALRMYTASAARATFEEGSKGTITPGKRADLIVLDRDVTRVPQDDLGDVEVEMTILDGRIVWDT